MMFPRLVQLFCASFFGIEMPTFFATSAVARQAINARCIFITCFGHAFLLSTLIAGKLGMLEVQLLDHDPCIAWTRLMPHAFGIVPPDDPIDRPHFWHLIFGPV